MANSEIMLLDISNLINQQIAFIAQTSSLGTDNHLSISGELIGYFNGQQFILGDLNIDGQEITIKDISEVDFESNVTEISFVADQLCSFDDDMVCTNLPVVNLIPATVNVITSPLQTLLFRILGDESDWRDAHFKVTQDGVPLNGRTEIFNGFLRFTPLLPGLVINGSAQIGLYVYPEHKVDGGYVKFDLPHKLKVHPLFSDKPVKLNALTPNATITGRLHNFSLIGEQLFAIDKLVVGDKVIDKSQFELDAAGTELSFTTSFATPGIRTVTASQSAFETS